MEASTPLPRQPSVSRRLRLPELALATLVGGLAVALSVIGLQGRPTPSTPGADGTQGAHTPTSTTQAAATDVATSTAPATPPSSAPAPTRRQQAPLVRRRARLLRERARGSTPDRELALGAAAGVDVRVPLACGERGGVGVARLELDLLEANPRTLSLDLELPAGVSVEGIRAGPTAEDAGARVQVDALGARRVRIRVECRRPLTAGSLCELRLRLSSELDPRAALRLKALRCDEQPARALDRAVPLAVEAS